MAGYRIVFVTAPAAQAKRLARGLLQRRLAACVNILGGVGSHYWWKGRLESARESLLLIKTQTPKVRSLIRHVRRRHPYSVPEVLSVPVREGNPSYLAWIRGSLKR